jgi:hypothetical protein
MKSAEFSQPALESLRERIQSADVQKAFDRLVEHGMESRTLACAPGGHGRVRDFRYTSVDPRGWPFAFTVSRAHILFQVRPLGVRTLRLSKTLLARHIEVVRKRADAELQIVVRNRPEADAVVEHLLSRWPPSRTAAEEGALADARHGLGVFRANVEQVEGMCRATGVMDRRHLRAVHLKPWAECSDVEKLDGNNGLLLSPHIAHLFERGYVSFADGGRMLFAQQLNSTVLKRWSISQPDSPRSFSPRQRPYLAWHRDHVFEKAAAGRRRRG